MKHKDWASLRNHAIDQFNGETPHPATEQEIIDAYELHPDAVEKAIAAVAADVKAGNVRSGWGILRHRAEAIRNPPANPTAKTGRKLEQSTSRAEQWIRNEGCWYPWNVVEAELTEHFRVGPTEHFKPLYEERAAQAAVLEREAEERGQKWIRDQQRLRELAAEKRATLDALQQKLDDDADLACGGHKDPHREEDTEMDGLRDRPPSSEPSAAGGETHKPAGNPEPGPNAVGAAKAAAEHTTTEATPL